MDAGVILLNNFNNISCVYKIVNLTNNKIYVGSAIKFKFRWNKHLSELNQNRHHSPHLQYAWNLYGETNFIVEILEVIENATKEILLKREQFYLDTLKPEYNTSKIAGSVLGIKRSAKTKDKLSAASKRRPPISEETRLKMSASAKLKIFTESHRKSMAEAQSGRTHPEEVKKKIAASHIGKKKTAEHVAKIWASRRRNKELKDKKINAE